MRGENIRFCAVLHEAILGDRYPVRIISARTLFVTLTGIEERMPDIILLHPSLLLARNLDHHTPRSSTCRLHFSLNPTALDSPAQLEDRWTLQHLLSAKVT